MRKIIPCPARTILLIAHLMITVMATGQSRQLTKAVDQIKNDLKNNGWEVLDEGMTDVNINSAFSTGEMIFTADRDYMLAAIIDNCTDCRVKLMLSDNTGQVMQLTPELDRFKNLTRVIYHLNREEAFRGTLEIYVDSRVKYTAYVMLARGPHGNE